MLQVGTDVFRGRRALLYGSLAAFCALTLPADAVIVTRGADGTALGRVANETVAASLATDKTANESLANRTAAESSRVKRASERKEPHADADVVDFMFDRLRHPLGGVIANNLASGTTAELMKIKRNGPEDLGSLLSASATSLFVVLVCLALLKALHCYLSGVFGQTAASQPRVEGLPEVGDDLLGWARAVGRLDEQQMMSAAGLDACMLREFHALCRRLFGILTLATLAVLGPLHFLASRAGTADYLGALDVGAVLGLADLKEADVLPELLPELRRLLELRRLPCWAHAAEVWLVVLVSLRLIFQAQGRFLQLRFRWLQSIRPPRATTLMVEGIPQELRSDGALKEYYGRLFSLEAVDRAYVVRRTQKLKRLVEEVQRLERQVAIARSKAEAGAPSSRLRAALAVLARWALLPAVVGDLEALEKDLSAARAAASEERDYVEAAVQRLDPAVCSQSGFVTFTTRRWCRLASREQLRADAGALKMGMPPDPDDVLFEDLAEDPTRGAAREWIASLLKFVVVCSWMPIVLTIACVADLATLRRRVHFVDDLCTRWPGLEMALQGFLASLLLQALMGKLPKVIMMIITNFQTLKSGAWAQLELQKTYFLLQIIFVLLVTAINQTVLASLQILIKQPQRVFELLADHLPSSSHFYVDYLAVGCTGLACSALRTGMLMKYVGFRLSGSDTKQARELAEVEDTKDVNTGTGVRMSRASFMATIGIVFCTCTPVITPFAWVYFAIGERTFPYLSVYGESRRPDLGGAFWLAALKGMIVALWLFVVLEVGILSRSGSPLAAVAAAASMSALLVGYSRLQQLRGEILPFEAVVDAECGLGSSSSDAFKPPPLAVPRAAYQQPECRAESVQEA